QQDERGALNADELGNLGDVAINVDLDGVRAHEGAALEVVEADAHAVRADRGVIGGRRLAGGEASHLAVDIGVDDGGERVHSGGLEPLRAPRLQIAAARRLELDEEVAEGRVLIGVLAEVRTDAGEELIYADVRRELLEQRTALGVRDAVEIDLHVLEIVDARHNGV